MFNKYSNDYDVPHNVHQKTESRGFLTHSKSLIPGRENKIPAFKEDAVKSQYIKDGLKD